MRLWASPSGPLKPRGAEAVRLQGSWASVLRRPPAASAAALEPKQLAPAKGSGSAPRRHLRRPRFGAAAAGCLSDLGTGAPASARAAASASIQAEAPAHPPPSPRRSPATPIFRRSAWRPTSSGASPRPTSGRPSPHAGAPRTRTRKKGGPIVRPRPRTRRSGQRRIQRHRRLAAGVASKSGRRSPSPRAAGGRPPRRRAPVPGPPPALPPHISSRHRCRCHWRPPLGFVRTHVFWT
mmetsp:Transcript_95763/g.249625  ORF Transcript_95763/g.249625 Transcript_95763/m.249625 type:complete len:237 (-) Transcript_95763:3-713(-)